MHIKFIQEKPYYIFEIESFLNDTEYSIIDENFPKVEKEKLKDGVGNKLNFNNRDQVYKDLDANGNKAIKILNEKFDENFFLDLTKKN